MKYSKSSKRAHSTMWTQANEQQKLWDPNINTEIQEGK